MNLYNQLMASISTISTGNLNTIISGVKNVMYALFGLLTVGAVVLAIIIVYRFFTASDEGKRKNAKAQLIYAIIGIVVLVVMLIFVPVLVDLITKEAGDGTTMFSLMF